MEVGVIMRQRRTGQGLSLEALAARCAVSRAMLSDIERGRKNPTVKVLCQIAAGLGCSASDLLGEPVGEPPPGLSLVRAGERRTLVDPQSGATRQVLSSAFGQRGVEVVWYQIPSGQGTGVFPSHPVGTAEHITIVDGQLHCQVGHEEADLQPGDSVSFLADRPHEFVNPGTVPCNYILIIDAPRRA